MDSAAFLRGLVLGVSVAAPVGPIGVLCIQRALAGGWRVGLASGLGAATADALYGAVAALGLTAISAWLLGLDQALRLGGGAYLLYAGARTLLARPAAAAGPGPDRSTVAPRRGAGPGLRSAYLSTLVLTLTNPMTILFFAAVFAGLTPAGAAGPGAGAALLILGVFLGSAAWWLALALGADRLRTHLGGAMLVWVNRLSGLVIAAFGLAALTGGFA
jgi:threonine/homoserine/homoserine lactone efflux protein